MCYSLSLLEPDTIQVRYAARFPAHWEVSPSYYIGAYDLPEYPVLPDMDHSHFHITHWGLIPFWVKNSEDAEKIRKQTINARSETLFEKPSFRLAVREHRCLVPADGFFEWRYYNGKNYPYYIHLRGHDVFSIAGIWDAWKEQVTGEEVFTFSVITCEANPLMARIHNKKKRMPVILPRDVEMQWLKHDLSADDIRGLLQPFPEDEMEAYTISKRVTSKTFERNVSEVIEPYEYKELPTL